MTALWCWNLCLREADQKSTEARSSGYAYGEHNSQPSQTDKRKHWLSPV